jgi:hypothetical protein
MRIPYIDTKRPSDAARQLAKLSADLPLSKIQAAVAKASGYRDWSELRAQVSPKPGGARDAAADAALILKLARALNLAVGDVQDAVARSRLVDGQAWSNARHHATRLALWRATFLGTPRPGQPGSLVKVVSDGRTSRRAYLRQAGRPTWVVYDDGPGSCADFEVVEDPREAGFIPRRLWAPYGYWTLDDGSIIVFSRDYYPLWRLVEGRVERPEPWWWILDTRSEFHFGVSLRLDDYNWDSGPTHELAMRFLEEHRVAGLPKLVDLMERLLTTDADRIADALEASFPPPGAELPLYATRGEHRFW